ncbi:hypothetical protein IRJ41_022434 [Triplophysa rosa]|uniref:Uncharacterized protein n=1 Tax=Triplophysa rosa TaxID=992332 RepID=A0A9W8C999_TRIRA|nr:hypothetical protein IRJ41_022434 [Triplophysa rosa]
MRIWEEAALSSRILIFLLSISAGCLGDLCLSCERRTCLPDNPCLRDISLIRKEGPFLVHSQHNFYGSACGPVETPIIKGSDKSAPLH